MSRLGHEFAMLYGRELARLADEVAAYEDDADLWSTMGGQKNPPGALALHTIGSLLCYIDGGLGGSGYVRDRDREFSERGVPRDEVVHRIRECRGTVIRVLEGLDDGMLAGSPPDAPPQLKGITTQGLLVHLLWHVGWHSGHVYYHRLALAEAASP